MALVAVAAALLVTSMAGRQPPAQPPQTTPVGAPAAPPPGRGGGRGNPMAAKFNEVCAACHGISAAKGPTAPSLFDDEWLHGSDDESIVKNIRDGLPDKGMQPFKDLLAEQETWQMVAYIRTTAANLEREAGLRARSGRAGRQSQKQTLGSRSSRAISKRPGDSRSCRTAGCSITERPGRAAHRRQGQAAARAGEGHAESVGEAGRRAARRRSASRIREERLDLPFVCRDAGRLRRALESAPGTRAPDPPSMTVIVRGRIDKNNEWVDEQMLYRAPDSDLQHQQRALWIAIHFRSAESPVLLARREAADRRLAGPVEADRQDPSHQRRRHDSERQSVREHANARARRSGATAIAIRRALPGIR